MSLRIKITVTGRTPFIGQTYEYYNEVEAQKMPNPLNNVGTQLISELDYSAVGPVS